MTIKNMFPIDLEGIKEILDEVNIENVSNFHSLMADILRLTEEIDSDVSLEEALDFIDKIKLLENNFRFSRLEDGKTFKEAVKVVESFYKYYEGHLKQKKIELQKKISDFINSGESYKKSDIKLFKNFFSKVENLDEIKADKKFNLNREWTISSIDIKKIDFEGLRYFFTEFQLEMAIKKHLKANGPVLDGVEYTKKLKI